MRRTIPLAAMVLVATALVVPTAAATPPQGPVTISTIADFTVAPVAGEFTVTEGADLLGCSAGTFVDYLAWENPSGGVIAKVLSCEGPGTGRFVANFQTFTGKSGPGDLNGNWNITSGTGDFARLHGHGDFWVVVAPDGSSGTETLTGTIHFD